MLSIFAMYKIGVGPSSSHTVGPMKAACEFIHELTERFELQQITKLTADVYGSLSLTGKGHHTDQAIIMGLAGNLPATVDIDAMPGFLARVEAEQQLPLEAGHSVDFPTDAIAFHSEALSLHENGMSLHAWCGDKRVFSKTYYSIGGGFIVDEQTFGQPDASEKTVPNEFTSAEQLLQMCEAQGVSISHLMRQNELVYHSAADLRAQAEAIWHTMQEGITRGTRTEGVLAGPLRVPRRASALKRQLSCEKNASIDPMNVIDWINMFALAASEENAAGGRVVTAPTNGAAGIIPAVMAYYDKFIHPLEGEDIERFLLASGAIGLLYKRNASVSGAEVGCQGEIGVACSMAAAGLAELMGCNPSQVCQAAEIGMEHNLGLTCDPVAGQVQVPCIERNAIAAVKAVNSARMAQRRNTTPRVSLDRVIETMYATGKDMNAKYRETSQGGLAIKVAYTCT